MNKLDLCSYEYYNAPVRLALFLLTAAPNNAALTPISPLDFPSGAVVLDFSGLTNGTEVNGLVFDGVPFQVTENGSPTNGIVVIDGGPGITPHISPPNLVSISDLDGVALIISLPNLATKFGYGYALRSENTVPAATTINLFAALTPIRDNSLALFLTCCREFLTASAYPNMTLLVSLVTVNILSA